MILRWGRELFGLEYNGLLSLAMSKASKLLKVTPAFDAVGPAALVLTSRCG